MGLCKCHRKKVTNLYCFEHRVCVCEHCTVENHSKCVIQSYLSWLEDSDYDPNCPFCRYPLAHPDVETIRLSCLHVFHWQCFNRLASSHPATTAPAGYLCPTCRGPIFPKPNQTYFTGSVSTAGPPRTRPPPPLPATSARLAVAPYPQAEPDVFHWQCFNRWASSHPATTAPAGYLCPTCRGPIFPKPNQCFNRWASSHPATTAPAGYLCPTCRGPIFPKPNQVSPIITQLVQMLQKANWARAGLGMEMLPELSQPYDGASGLPGESAAVNMETEKLSQAYQDPSDPQGMRIARKPLLSDQPESINSNGLKDADENKYARRPASEWLGRFLKSRSTVGMDRPRRWTCRRVMFMGLFLLILVVTLAGVLLRMGRSSADSDPFLDPFANPNIHVDRISDQ